MSTETPPPAAPAAPIRTTRSPHREITIISHSNLYYWWPVWAVGFIMSAITYFSGQVLATVPAGSAARKNVVVDTEPREAIVAPAKKHLPIDPVSLEPARPHLQISGSKNLGVLFCTVLLLVIAITNIPLRGLFSVMVILFIVFLATLFAVLGWWDPIFENLSLLDIRINLGGYLFISTVLFVIWIIVFLFFDQQIYMVFTPGQLRVRLEIGEGETAYDTAGMTIQKQRSDLFRHWILGLGSGDLIVRTSGAQAHYFDLPNVLFVGRKVKEIEEMLRQREVVAG